MPLVRGRRGPETRRSYFLRKVIIRLARTITLTLIGIYLVEAERGESLLPNRRQEVTEEEEEEPTGPLLRESECESEAE